ncbi:acyl carrier protein [Bacillus bingmayongensis]|uniref:acyl carrier protein n=1 Tax=Bacillus bingmayongensis TaxID=1150157 RepID=UPI0003035199|nr:acyl carrier protein [Bacillus bingmayongensis]MBY0595861.1 acyl carrier protein [Bacillus bingmayongensis]
MTLTSTLTELLADILEVEEEEIVFNKELSDYEGWDSVNSLRILTHVEDEFNLRLSMERYAKVQTIGELQELIEETKNEQ